MPLRPRRLAAAGRFGGGLSAIAALAALTLALLLWAGGMLRERILSEAARELATQADIAAAATQRRLQALRFALNALPSWIDGTILASGAVDLDVHEALKVLAQAGGTGVGLIAIAPDGRVAASARAVPADDPATASRADPNLATLGPPTRSGLSLSVAFPAGPDHIPGRPVVAVSRPLPGGGWVQALVPVDAPFGLLPAADLGEGSAIWLAREDGKAIARWPLPLALPAPTFFETPLFQEALPRSSDGMIAGGPSPLGQADAITVWRSIPEFGLVLVLARDREAVLAPWRAAMATTLAALLIALVAAALLAWRWATVAMALTRSEDRARTVANALGLLLWSRPSRYAAPTYHSDVAEALTGHKAEEMTKRHGFWRDHVVHPDDRAWVSAGYATADMEKGLAQTYRIVRADGAVRWVEGRIRAVPGGGLAGVVADVTAQRETEARLARSEAELAEAMRIAGLGRWRLASEDGRFEFSDEILKQFGVSPGRFDPTMESVVSLVLPEDRPVVAEAFRRVREKGEVVEFEYRLRRPDGALRHRWARAALERDAADQPTGAIVGVCQDITERREAATQLAHASRMAALGQLTGGIAHDVNNMLTVVSLNLDLLADVVPKGTVAAEALEAARRAAAGGSGLAAQLLAFARRQPLKPEPVDVAALFDELRPMLARTLGRRIAVTLAAAPGTGRVRADAAQLRSALVNLAINARDAMPAGGAITIAAAPGEGGAVAFSVADTGTGMPPEVAARAFEPFFTTKPAGKGTGLGLSQVYGFVTQSQGTVAIDSHPGEGTVVRFTLPAAEGPGRSAEAAAGPRRGSRVLLVEDEPGLRSVAATMLAAAGLAVTEAGDAAAAMALIEAGLVPDLLFTDVNLGDGADGAALAALARRRVPGLAVLFATGFAAEADLPEDAAVLTKPYAREALLAAVSSALSGAAAEPVTA